MGKKRTHLRKLVALPPPTHTTVLSSLLMPARWQTQYLLCFNTQRLNIHLFLLFLLTLQWTFPSRLPAATVAAADLNSDSQALLTFYNGLILAKRVNWNANVNVCTWAGVGCNPNQDRVSSVRLPGTGLYGQIPPSSLGLLSELRFLSLRSNKLSGPLPLDLVNCTQLRGLYLQDNLLTGPLPSFKPSRHLSRINLSFNQFNGSIPVAFNGLPKLGILYLQNNSLAGSIPATLDLPNLRQFSVANNELNGRLPRSLQRFSSSAFSGNQFCGAPLFSPCPSIAPFPAPVSSAIVVPRKKSKKLTTGDIVAIVVVAIALFFIISVGLLVWCWRRRSCRPVERTFEKGDSSKDEFSSAQESERNKLVFFGADRYIFDLEDLMRASAVALGKGSVGTAYKAVLEDESTVVVKRLKDVVVGRKDFEQQMELIGRMRHKNLVSLRAYYFSKDEKLLVYDYLPIGSLSVLLHGSKDSGCTPLDWDSRLKIAIEAARGIAYIHEHGGTKCAHGNIKSSNVLLDRHYDACISDFGLAPLFSSTVAASRIVGYRAPEVAEIRKVTHKSDVYSFGVLLLELLTGKVPMQASNEEGIDLPRWVQSIVREEWTAEVFDEELMRYQNIEEEMVQMLQIAMACVVTMPDQRPKMAQVVRMIEDVRQFETDENRQSSSDKSKESNGYAPPHRGPREVHTP